MKLLRLLLEEEKAFLADVDQARRILAKKAAYGRPLSPEQQARYLYSMPKFKRNSIKFPDLLKTLGIKAPIFSKALSVWHWARRADYDSEFNF